jgi:hypothetical protein
LGLCRYSGNRSSRLYLYYHIRHHHIFLLVNLFHPLLDPHDRAELTIYRLAKPLRSYRLLPCNPKCLRMVSFHVFSQSVSSHSRSLRQPEHAIELGNKPTNTSLTRRLAIQTLVPSRSRIDGLRYISPTRHENGIDIDSSTSSTLVPAIVLRLLSIESSRSRTHLTRFSPHPNVSAQTITFCGPVQLVFETGGPDISGIFRVNWLMRSPSLLLTKLVQCVSRIADFTR